MVRPIALLVAALALSSCDSPRGEARSIRLVGTSSLSSHDAAVITRRLDPHTPRTLFQRAPQWQFTAAGADTILQADAAPPDERILYLLSRRGVLQAKADDGSLWFTDKDVEDAQAGFDETQRPVLKLKLSRNSGARIAKLSSTNMPRVLVVALDGEALITANVRGTIPDGMLQVTVDRPASDVLLIATILRSGALSYAPGAVQVQKR